MAPRPPVSGRSGPDGIPGIPSPGPSGNAQLVRVLVRIDLILDGDGDSLAGRTDEDVDVHPLPLDDGIVEVGNVDVDDSHGVISVSGKALLQERLQENISEPVILGWVQEEPQEVGVAHLLTYGSDGLEHIELSEALLE